MPDARPERLPRGATRFDTSRQDLFTRILIGLLTVLVLAGIVVIILSFFPKLALTITGGGFSRAIDEAPRSIDMWAVYPDSTVRFVTIFYPDPETSDISTTLELAGPLIQSPVSSLDATIFGGVLLNTEVLPGPGGDSGYLYERYDIAYEGGDVPYGVDARVQSPPYLVTDDDGRQQIALGAEVQDPFYYKQIVVAVALPDYATIFDVSSRATDDDLVSLRPYRRRHIGEWIVYYFDTTDLPILNTIAITYELDANAFAPRDFDYEAVDAAR